MGTPSVQKSERGEFYCQYTKTSVCPQNRKINYQKLSIVIVAIVFIIILAVFIPKLFTKNNELKFNDFEKAAIYRDKIKELDKKDE